MTLESPGPTAERPIPALGGVLGFMSLMWAVDHALQRASKRMARTLGVTGPQRLVIRLSGRFPGITAGRLAKLMHIHPSTLTGVLRRLESQDLMRCRRDSGDRRRLLISLTEKGKRYDVDAEGTIEAGIRRATRSLSPTLLAAAREALSAIAEELRRLDSPHGLRRSAAPTGSRGAVIRSRKR